MVKQLTGFDINHVVNIDFTGFADAVDAIGCVYVDVDRHYYIDRRQSFDGYAEINIEAGYQRMCGYNALQYVRYRHDDNDLVRSARQQDFLREARRQLPPTKIFNDINSLTQIVTKYTSSDPTLQDFPTLLSLAKSLPRRAAPVTQIHFPAIIGSPTDPYVTAHRTAIQDAVRTFLGESSSAPRGRRAEHRRRGEARSGAGRVGRRLLIRQVVAPQRRFVRLQRWRRRRREPGHVDIVVRLHRLDDVGAAVRGETLRSAGRRDGKIPIHYPTQLIPGSLLTATRTPTGSTVRARRSTTAIRSSPRFRWSNGYGYTDYYGVSGTDWVDAPILDNPSETQTIDGEVQLFYDGGRLRLVGWKTNKGAYWVNNTCCSRSTRARCSRSRRRCASTKAKSPAWLSETPIGVIGVGWVGLVTAACFAELGHEVVAVDIDDAKIEALRARRRCRSTSPAWRSWWSATASGCAFTTEMDEVLGAARLLFCCVDTPPTYSGDADLSRVEAVVAALPEGGDHALVMKSTVPRARAPRSGARTPDLVYVSCPEFLKEGTAVKDFLHPDRVVIGADPGAEWAADAVAGALRARSAARSCAPTSPRRR